VADEETLDHRHEGEEGKRAVPGALRLSSVVALRV